MAGRVYVRTGQGVLERDIRVHIIDRANVAKLLFRQIIILVLLILVIVFLVSTLGLFSPLAKPSTLFMTWSLTMRSPEVTSTYFLGQELQVL